MLSNTAVPKEYALFREEVIRGTEPIPDTIALEMARIDRLIADPTAYYDSSVVDGFIAFCEQELCLVNGDPMHLLRSFRLWAEELLGWYRWEITTNPEPDPDNPHRTRYVKRRTLHRLVNKQVLIIGRGAAKTMYVYCIHAYFLVVDSETTVQCAIAPTIDQADETLSPLRTTIARSRGPVFKFLTDGSLQNTTGERANRPKLASTKKGIQNFLTNSILETVPMRLARAQSRRDKICSIDEWLSTDIREDVSGAMQQSLSKNRDWILLMISSEGTIRNSVGDTIKLELMKILKGENGLNMDWVSIWWYKLDSEDEVGDPKMWRKANPNLGHTVSYEEYRRDVEQAQISPDKLNDVLAKRFGLAVEGYSYYFTYEETQPYPKRLNFRGMDCALGIDMSSGDDFCAFSFLFPISTGEYGFETLCIISEYTLHKLPLGARAAYEEFMEEGSLLVLEGITLDAEQVYQEVNDYIQNHNYNVLTVGYDTWGANTFMSLWEINHSAYGLEKVPQGKRTESIPLGEMKKLAEDGKILFNQKLITFCMGNCMIEKDVNGNKMLTKKDRASKIDAFAAYLDAYIAYKANKVNF